MEKKGNGGFLVMVMLGLFLGSLDELIQFFYAQRTTSLYDVGADGLGIGLGLIAFFLVTRLGRQRAKSLPF